MRYDGVDIMMAIMVMVFTLIVLVALIPGLGMPRSESTYTGYVVDIEYESGLVLKNTIVHVKTHPRSSSSEKFCVAVPKDEAIVTDARDALMNQSRITIQYERGVFENPFHCADDYSMVTDTSTAPA